MLDVQPAERVIDWFCGLGNFTLPLATRAREVLGLEGSPTLIARARAAAALNGLQERVVFEARNLFELGAQEVVGLGRREVADRSAAEGAFAIAKALADLHQDPPRAPGFAPPRRIVYVSCNPATLARDAGLLVHQAGYRCAAAGAINMFPHTAHVESIALFERAGRPGHGRSALVRTEPGTRRGRQAGTALST